METDKMIFDLTQGLFDTETFTRELILCRDAMARYYLSSEENDKDYCYERYTILTQIVDTIKSHD